MEATRVDETQQAGQVRKTATYRLPGQVWGGAARFVSAPFWMSCEQKA